MLGNYHINIIYDILKDLHFFYQSDKIFAHLAEKLCKALDSEAASIYVSDPKREKLRFYACIGPKQKMLEIISEEIYFSFGDGLCGWVAQNNDPLMLENVKADTRFDNRVDVMLGYNTKNLMCAPLSIKEDVLGVIEVLNKKNSAYNKNDLDLLDFFAKEAAIALQNAGLYKALNESIHFNESVLAGLSEGCITADQDGILTHINRSAEDILQINAALILGKSHTEVLQNVPQFSQRLAETLNTKTPARNLCIDFTRSDSQMIKIGYSSFLVTGKSGETMGSGITFQNLT